MYSHIVFILLQILESLDPGCDGKLLVSKLTRDEIPQKNYRNLNELVDSLDQPDQFGEFEGTPEEWCDKQEWSGDDGEEFNWREKLTSENDFDDDDIQVRMVESVKYSIA